MKPLLVNQDKFIDWYFHDYITDYDSLFPVADKLKEDGEYKVTANDLLEDVSYIVPKVLEDNQIYFLNEYGNVDKSKYILKFSKL